MSARRKTSRLLVAAGVAIASSVIGLTTAQTASASDCTQASPVTDRQYFRYQGQEVGFVQLMWFSGTKQVCTWLHINSGFRANHTGWNITLSNQGQTSSGSFIVFGPVTRATNSSAIDFVTDPVSIYATSSENWSGVFTWAYNSCNYVIGTTENHNFSNGYTQPNSGDSTPC
ncbi:hypothetical protein ACIBHX_19460 [Nonomuraea sp. NPDC050536]|uniref:hypothetical protein n=1 Tax=Nonomuraea sp. NPDC050536 TaxID=3364366 RepID=UPI0037C88F2E